MVSAAVSLEKAPTGTRMGDFKAVIPHQGSAMAMRLLRKKLGAAMDAYKVIAQELIDKLILETNQPEKSEIIKGNYYLISNAELRNDEEHLTGNWYFDVHGEHCMFENLATGQKLEVSLGNTDDIGTHRKIYKYDDRDSYLYSHVSGC